MTVYNQYLEALLLPACSKFDGRLLHVYHAPPWHERDVHYVFQAEDELQRHTVQDQGREVVGRPSSSCSRACSMLRHVSVRSTKSVNVSLHLRSSAMHVSVQMNSTLKKNMGCDNGIRQASAWSSSLRVCMEGGPIEVATLRPADAAPLHARVAREDRGVAVVRVMLEHVVRNPHVMHSLRTDEALDLDKHEDLDEDAREEQQKGCRQPGNPIRDGASASREHVEVPDHGAN
eukprot:CAMPEP_0195076234 /NCGR_PEP_ID=MMETSP0448-20130528/18933_1 /TAXON_ID=66468 /ORGANISM="Heterocapsa triquestra, Strain CCMP 448" /LENGTH=231 /DNA_ID=CAMNT_0040108727 /DNA_START=401 /DNA_END=1097 /DNA_ORIENTATION=-